MTPGLIDHLFVLLVLVIAFPIGGWWAYRRFLARLSAIEAGDLDDCFARALV